ncbi:MAG: hypothetical protein RLZZ179_3238 [Verrucomicrobiota bacterium]
MTLTKKLRELTQTGTRQEAPAVTLTDRPTARQFKSSRSWFPASRLNWCLPRDVRAALELAAKQVFRLIAAGQHHERRVVHLHLLLHRSLVIVRRGRSDYIVADLLLLRQQKMATDIYPFLAPPSLALLTSAESIASVAFFTNLRFGCFAPV